MNRLGDEQLTRWASRHHGLYRTEDALRLGLTRRQIRYRVEQHRSLSLGTDVYRIAGSQPTRDQTLLSAAWRAKGAVSHRSAAELLGLIDARAGHPHVVVERRRGHDLPGIVTHRTSDLLPSDITEVRGIPVTTTARTLVDMGLLVSERDLETALHRGLHQGLVTIDQVRALHKRIARRGRHGSGPISALLASYDATAGPAESVLEVVILRLLRAHGVAEPTRQHPVEVGGRRFRLDLAYPSHQLFLEGDGFGVHGARGAFEDDRHRQNLLVAAGWWPLRITWRMAHDDPTGCADLVGRKLAMIEQGGR